MVANDSLQPTSPLSGDLIRHTLDLARKNGFVEVEIEIAQDRFRAVLDPVRKKVKHPVSMTKSELETVDEPVRVAIKAPLVGYYRPGKVVLQNGAQVAKGDAVAVIAALGIANDIESPDSGEVVDVLVEVDQPVEFGQVLAWIEPSGSTT
jgi:acetyl-CoA carboxylase biotin carboxyl carrier protein